MSTYALDIAVGLLETTRDLVPLRWRKTWCRPFAQSTQSAPRDRPEDIEVPQQLIDRGQRLSIGRTSAFLTCAQVQLWIAQHQLARLGQARAVPAVQLTDLARAQLLACDRRGESQCVFAVGARQRQQVLHRRVRHQLAATHTLLNLFRKLSHQAEPPADPTAAAVESTRQLFGRKLEAPVKLSQQPALLDRAVRRSCPHRPIDDQRFRLLELPGQRPDRVLPQAPKGTDSLVAINDDEAITAVVDHDDRHLLAGLGQRSHQSALPRRAAAFQAFVTQLQLM